MLSPQRPRTGKADQVETFGMRMQLSYGVAFAQRFLENLFSKEIPSFLPGSYSTDVYSRIMKFPLDEMNYNIDPLHLWGSVPMAPLSVNETPICMECRRHRATTEVVSKDDQFYTQLCSNCIAANPLSESARFYMTHEEISYDIHASLGKFEIMPYLRPNLNKFFINFLRMADEHLGVSFYIVVRGPLYITTMAYFPRVGSRISPKQLVLPALGWINPPLLLINANQEQKKAVIICCEIQSEDQVPTGVESDFSVIIPDALLSYNGTHKLHSGRMIVLDSIHTSPTDDIFTIRPKMI